MSPRIIRISIIVCALLILVAQTWAFDLGPSQSAKKTNSHVGQNPGQPDGRQGGETIETAFPIIDLPFSDTGNTSNNVNDYDESCPYGDSLSPDVVYSFTPSSNMVLDVDLCGSGYDTKTYIYDSNIELVACNDDYYFDQDCGNYVSMIESAPLTAGQTYFIVIDGYGGDSGDYNLVVDEGIFGHSCLVDCDGTVEGEPELQDGYNDEFNSGCGAPGGEILLQTLSGDEDEYLFFCGISGWYETNDGSEFRDTDWFTAQIGSTGIIEWLLDAEQEVLGFLLGPQDCSEVAVIQSLQCFCSPEIMVIQGTPGDTVWLWVGPSQYTAPFGFVGNGFPYNCQFEGLAYQGPVATQQHTFDSLKSLYR